MFGFAQERGAEGFPEPAFAAGDEGALGDIVEVDVAIEIGRDAASDAEFIGEGPGEGLEPGNPREGREVRCGMGGTQHPAIMGTAGDAGAGLGGTGAAENLLPGLGGEVADFEIGAEGAGVDAAPRVDDGGIAAGTAGVRTGLAEDFLHEAEVEVGQPPVGGSAGLQQFENQRLDGAGDADAVEGFIVDFQELESIVERGGDPPGAMRAGEFIEGEDLVGVVILERDREGDLAGSGGGESAKGFRFAFESVFFAADGVVFGAYAVEGDEDVDVGVFPDNGFELAGLEAIGDDVQLAGFRAEEVDDPFKVGTQGGFAAGEGDGAKPGRQLGQHGEGDFFGGEGGMLPDVAHGATGVAAIGKENGEIHGPQCSGGGRGVQRAKTIHS